MLRNHTKVLALLWAISTTTAVVWTSLDSLDVPALPAVIGDTSTEIQELEGQLLLARTEAQQHRQIIDDQTALIHDLVSQIDRQETERTYAPTERFSYGPKVAGHFNALLCWEGLAVEELQ